MSCVIYKPFHTIPAMANLALVWVSVLGVDAAVLLDVLEGKVHESTVAAVVAEPGGAVDQVLLGELHQRPRHPGVLTF